MATPQEQHEVRNALPGLQAEIRKIEKALREMKKHMKRIEKSICQCPNCEK